MIFQRDRDSITRLIEDSIPSSAIQENGLPEWIATAWQLHVENHVTVKWANQNTDYVQYGHVKEHSLLVCLPISSK